MPGFLQSLNLGSPGGLAGKFATSIQSVRGQFKGPLSTFKPIQNLTQGQAAGGPGFIKSVQANMKAGKGILGLRQAFMPSTSAPPATAPAPAPAPAAAQAAPASGRPTPGYVGTTGTDMNPGDTAVIPTDQRGITVVVR